MEGQQLVLQNGLKNSGHFACCFFSSFLLFFTAVIVETLFLLQRLLLWIQCLPAVDFKYSYLVTNVYHSICVDPTYNVRSATKIHVMHGKKIEIDKWWKNKEKMKPTEDYFLLISFHMPAFPYIPCICLYLCCVFLSLSLFASIHVILSLFSIDSQFLLVSSRRWLYNH